MWQSRLFRQLAVRRGDEVGRSDLGPRGDCDRRHVGGGEQAGQSHDQDDGDDGGDGGFFQDVVAPCRPLPRGTVSEGTGATGDAPLGAGDGERVDNPSDAHGQYVRADEGHEHHGDQHHVPEEHLAHVHEVEESAHADPIKGVFAAGGDPLRIEILLGQVAGETLDHRCHEGDHAGDPGEGPPAAPCGHPELAPQVNDHEGHERFDAPQVKAVEEMSHRVGVPPVGAPDGDGEAGHDHHRQGGQGGHPEDVDPRGDVGGLAVGEQLAGWQVTQGHPAQPRRPHGGVDVAACVEGLGRNVPSVASILFRGGGRSGASPVARERDDQGSAKDHDHHGDQHKIGFGDRKDRPVEISAWAVQVAQRSQCRCIDHADNLLEVSRDRAP